MNTLSPRLLLFSVLLPFLSATCGSAQDETRPGEKEVPPALNFTVESIDGTEVNLADYQGKVLVVVNVASKCGYTRQYADLQKLYSELADEGLEVLGFPCNQFRNQEPLDNAAILEFCRLQYDVTFDMFAKIDVNGENASPLYKYLCSLDTRPKGSGDVSWNFEKFVIDRKGNVVGRFGSKTEIGDQAFMDVISESLQDSD